MERNDSSAAMASLANVYGEDESDNEEKPTATIDEISDEESFIKIHEIETIPIPFMSKAYSYKPIDSPASLSVSPATNSDENQQNRKKRATKLVSYGADEHDEGRSSGDSDDEDSSYLGVYDVTLVDTVINHTSLSQSVRNLAPDEIQLPPEPAGRCSNHLQDKIARMYEKVKQGMDITSSIMSRKDISNPSIYEKLIEYCNIDEKGTNYPPDIFDPHCWGKESFYDALAEVQKKEMDRREKERKDRTKIDFISGVKKNANSAPAPVDHSANKKSKWDTTASRPSVITTSAVNPAVVSVTTSTMGLKTTLISAVGNMMKK